MAESDTAQTIERATPAHLRRPKNYAQEAIDAYTKDGGFISPETQKRLVQLRREAREREKAIDKQVAKQVREYEVANDPEIARCLAHNDSAAKNAAPEDKQQLLQLRGLILGGGAPCAPQYWEGANQLAEKQKEHAKEQISATGAVLDQSYAKYCASQAALERAVGEAEASLLEAKRQG